MGNRAAAAGTSDGEVLRDRLARALRRRHGEAVEVKESFTQASDSVAFTLLAKRKSVGRWDEVVSLERPRLKTARLAAYDAALRAASAHGTPPPIGSGASASHANGAKEDRQAQLGTEAARV